MLDFRKIEDRVIIWAIVTVIAIVANLVTTTVLTTHVIIAEQRTEERFGRLARAIGRTADQVNRELQGQADELEALRAVNRYPWTRNNMTEFCIDFEKMNPGTKCPNILALSPDFGVVFRPRILPVTPYKDRPEDAPNHDPVE